MDRVARTFLATSVLLSSALAAAGSCAASLGVDERELVSLDVRAEVRVTTRITTDDRTLLETCTGPCSVRVPRGHYRVRVDGPGLPSRTVRLDARRATRIDVDPGNSAGRWTGLAVGISGSATFAVGFVGTVFSHMCREQCSSQQEATGRVMLGVTGIGAAVGVLGWLLFAGSATSVDISERAPAREALRGFAIAVAPTKGGATVAIGFPF